MDNNNTLNYVFDDYKKNIIVSIIILKLIDLEENGLYHETKELLSS